MNNKTFDDTYLKLVEFTNKVNEKGIVNHIENNSPQIEVAEEFTALLEELNIACEELKNQNDQLAQSNQLIANQRAKFEELFDSAPSPYVTTDRKATIQSVNRAFGQLIEHKESSLLKGKPLSVYFSLQCKVLFYDSLAKLNNESHQQASFEAELTPRNLPAMTVLVNVSKLRESNNQLLWTIQDLSYRKALEKATLYDQVNDFVAALMHDLRVPVIGASMLLEHLVDVGNLASDEETQKEVQSYLSLLKSNNDALLKNINSLLEIYKLDSTSKEEILEARNIEQINIEQIVKQCISTVSASAKSKNIDLNTEIDSELTFNAASEDIKRILVCLIDNAVKHSHINGSVDVRACINDNNLTIEVEDYGPGISKMNQKQLFNRLWSSPKKDDSRSSGYGLFLCKKLIDLYDGTISCKSRLRRGTKFIVQIPANQPIDTN